MGALTSIVARDGARNAVVHAAGMGASEGKWVQLLDIKRLNPIPTQVHIDAVYYSMSKDVEVQLAWEGVKSPIPFLSLEGRGRIDYSEVGGLFVPKGGERSTGHILARVLNGKDTSVFSFILDLSKHLLGA